jgi:hypothetical protein
VSESQGKIAAEGRTGTGPEKAKPRDGLALRLVSGETESFVEAALEAGSEGAKSVCVAPWGERAQAVAEALRAARPQLKVSCRPEDKAKAPALRTEAAGAADVDILLHQEGEGLAEALLEQLDRRHGLVLAAQTPCSGLNRAIFLVSIPKAGTHLLLELARAMGFADGGQFDHATQPGCWHYVEYSNSHTAAPDFFLGSVRQAAFGNRHHPFPSTPTLFAYRHPLDILVSEANYYHKPGKTIFSGYLEGLSFEERVLRLLDDPWLLGTLRDRVGKFCAWLEFGNVVPLSFEELVGAQGGGTDAAQRRLIWSVLLKLQVSGAVEEIARKVFNPGSATFRAPRIGGHRQVLHPAAWERIRQQPADYFERFGYSPDQGAALFSSRCEEFLRRPLRLQQEQNANTPMLLEQGVFGYNIVLLRRRFVAVPCSAGPLDLGTMTDEQLEQRFLVASQLLLLRRMILDAAIDERQAVTDSDKAELAP